MDAKGDVILAETKTEISLPKGMEASEAAKLEQNAFEIVESLEKNAENRTVLGKLENLGVDAQREAARKMELLKGRVGTLLSEVDGEGSAIPNGLVALRDKLDEINPHKLSQPGFFSKLIGKTPVVGDVLKKIAIRYEEVNKQIDIIIDSLRNGKDDLLKDNIELEELYDSLKVQQKLIIKNAFFGEMLMEKLEDLLSRTDDMAARQRIEGALNAVAMRTQDLRTIEQVNNQFFVSIDMTVTNNKMLMQSIERTLTVTTNLITVGLSIQAALVKQKKILEATKATQDYASEVLAANAASIKQNTKEIGNMYKDPVLSLEKVKQAYNDLVDSMDELERIKQEGIQKAKSGIAELNKLSSDLTPKMEALHSAGKVIDGGAPKEVDYKND